MTAYDPGPTTPRAWGWLAHLESGGTTPWHAWTQPGRVTRPVFPGAQQLQLLRRINLAGAPSTTTAQRVLTATAGGRGGPALPLDGAAHPGWGPRPVDPEALASGELVRVAATLLAEDLVAMGVAEPTERPRRWRRRVQLAGDPLAVAHARAHLTAAGRLPGGPGARTVVLLASSEVMLSHLWTYRCFGRRVVRWSDWVGRQSARDRLPALLDPTRSVPSRTPPRAVRVITRPDLVTSRGVRAWGLRGVTALEAPGADGAELARRITMVLAGMVPADQVEPLVARTLWRHMPSTAVPPPRVGVEHRAWLSRVTDRLVGDLGRSGYPVVGDVADLVPHFATPPPGTGDCDHVLDLAVAMLADDRWKHQPRRV